MSTTEKPYVETGPREKQLYARLGTDGLVAVLELDTDCHGRVFTYFMRGGIEDGCMSVAEFERAPAAMAALMERARVEWPGWFERGMEE